MFTGSAARRIAAALTATLVAVLLVTFSGSSHASTQRQTVAGTSHAGTAAKATRLPQATPTVPLQHAPLLLDLVTTPPEEPADVRVAAVAPADEQVDVRLGSDRVAPTGRAPPAR